LSDLKDWGEDLPPPFDSSVAVLSDKDNPTVHVRVLRSTSFDTCTSAFDVRAIAIPLVRTLSGLIGVRREAMPVAFDGLIQLMDDGSWKRYTLGEANQMMRSPKTRATASVGGDNSSSAPATPSYAQLTIQGLSDDLRAALSYYDMADNWYDLYKSYEAVLSHLNPRNEARAKDKLQKLGLTYHELRGLKGSAQHHRHHETDAPNDFTFHEAKALTRRIIDAVLQSDRSPSG